MENAELVKQDDWIPARLLPTAGIRNQKEQERRAASALLAVMSAVPDLCHALLSQMKAPKGTISTYTELRFKDGDDKLHIPDGAVVIERGKTRWSCLVEIKTGNAVLDPDQVTRYLDLAREHEFDGLLTISNEIRSDPKTLPYTVDKRKLRGLTVYHLSWWRVLTEAIVQYRFRGVDDPDQAWILNELIRYLDDDRSGASGFEGMGPEWVQVRESARNQTLRASDKEAGAIASRWEHSSSSTCACTSARSWGWMSSTSARGARAPRNGSLGSRIDSPERGPWGVRFVFPMRLGRSASMRICAPAE